MVMKSPTLTINRRPLRERESILSSDVSDALEQLVAQNGGALPVAFDKNDVVEKLIEIANTGDDGIVNEPLPIARRALQEQFRNRLSNTAVFQAGYKRYEGNSELPVVPVTEFFFKHVYEGGDTADCLDGMSDHEITQSLPKRASFARVKDKETGLLEYVRNESGEMLTYGELAGVIIFPQGMVSNLLRAWLDRRAKAAAGLFNNTVERLEHARPGGVAVENLKAHKLESAMRQALPRPRSAKK